MRSTWFWQQVLGGTDLGRYPTRGDRVLDVGCGYGRNAFLVQSLGAEWIGLDVDSKVVNNLLEQGLTAVCGTLEEYARTSPECFDTILLSQILEHVPEPIPFLRAAFDILKPGGRLYVSCPNSASRYRQKLGARWLHWHVPYHVLQWNRESLTKAAEQAGFAPQWFRARTPPSWYMMQRNFKSVERGCRNTSFRFKFKPPQWVAVFSWTILLDLLYPDSGDALVACLRKTERHP
jgi:SAM-dependent methyltransferase